MQGIPGQAGAQGIPGVAGAQGPTGSAGPQGVPGPVGLAYQGSYSSVANYALADGVTYNGSSYVSLVAGNHGNTPGQSPAAWALIAAAGSAGAAGATGATGPAGAIGPQGLPGPAGPQGTTGATGPQGPPVVRYTGAYNPATSYSLNDAASFGGSTYVSMLDDNHGNTPDVSPGYWTVLVAQGAPGAAGPAGAAGAPGVAGPAGPAGATGPQGPPVSFIGGWLTSRAYATGDAVSYSGGSYIALQANTGRQPDISPVYWAVLAQSGAPGPAGPAGPMGLEGPTGFPGPTGPQGPAGPIGATGSIGPVGPAGATGPAGPAGPAGAAGVAGLAYRGAYSSTANYALNDAVTFSGSSYISLTDSNHGNTPDQSPAMWSLLARQGSPGVAGAIGAIGPQGLTGPAGPTGAPGANGANGAPGLNFRGPWGSGVPYALNDAVTYAGSTYLALVSNSAVEPDTGAGVWAVLAAVGAAGPAGPTGAAASVQIGTVTTGPPGSSAVVTNSGSATAAVLNFTLPQGATGAAGTGGTGGGAATSGIPYASMYHAVSFSNLYYSVNSSNSAASESDSVLTWVPDGCTASKLVVFSNQSSSTLQVTLRSGSLGIGMTDTALSCALATGTSCTSTGSVAIPAGSFVDLSVTHASGTAAGVWTALACN
ncbi:hypothetical protein FTO74_15540 [Granulicella sp. WH15]|uniref:hypothetical protein n=1 Tax=Granulicella sp. WH15 TaxID=2602070 RepID=UPI0013672632|nr:hypothetical protein [Granulicella sp. WH15]QHN04617.1 hypothetical protein FTO74_15540 [Granulicella sp. WH15]